MRYKMRQTAARMLLLCLFTLSSWAAPATAALETAQHSLLAYLINEQNGDGSWGEGEREKMRLTATALEALRHYGVSGVVYHRGISWLANAKADTVDGMARKAIVLSDAGADPVDAIYQMLDSRASHLAYGFWGSQPGHVYTTIDTSLAVQLFSRLPVARRSQSFQQLVNSYLSLLNAFSVRNEGWDWSVDYYTNDAGEVSRVIPTAYALMTLQGESAGLWSGNGDFTAATWLAAKSQSNGVIADNETGQMVSTALAARALGLVKTVPGAPSQVGQSYSNAQTYLVSQVDAKGSLAGDIFASALALKALSVAPQPLADTDGDGLPDEVEIVLGTDPNQYSLDQLTLGNGKHYDPEANQSGYLEVMEGADVTVDLFGTSIQIVSGHWPEGMSLHDGRQLTGKPTAQGVYTVVYTAKESANKSISYSLVVGVVDPDSDWDGDGLTAREETEFGTSLMLSDTDGDGKSDKEAYDEAHNGVSQMSLFEASLTSAATDGDTTVGGFAEGEESTSNTSSEKPLSDGVKVILFSVPMMQ